jgi:hypothetical protein
MSKKPGEWVTPGDKSGPSRPTDLGGVASDTPRAARENCPGVEGTQVPRYIPPHRRNAIFDLGQQDGRTTADRSWEQQQEFAADRQFVDELIQYLDDCEVIREINFGDLCPKCGTNERVLDESLMILVPKSFGGSLANHFAKKDRVKHSISTFIGADGIFKVPAIQGGLRYFGTYEIKNSLVNSGIWSREQLTSKGLTFSQHELEVNDRSFYHLRPHSCVDKRADFWEEVAHAEAPFWNLDRGEIPDDDSDNLSECPPGMEDQVLHGFYLEDVLGDTPIHPILGSTSPKGKEPLRLTGVETEFISGHPVRTGFRRRSKSATIRRKHKRSVQTYGFYRIRTPLPQEACSLLNITADSIPSVVRLSLSNIKCIRKRRYHRRHTRSSRPNRGPVRGQTLFWTPPKQKFEKYCYFFRKRGCFYLSKHHPVTGDLGVI